MPSHAENQKRLTKDCLSTALFRLMEKRSLDSISVTEIAGIAGVSRAAFYRNYNDKKGIIAERLDSLFAECFGKVSASGQQFSESTLVLYFSFFREKKAIVKALIRAEMLGLFVGHLSHAVDQFFRPKTQRSPDGPSVTKYRAWYMAAGLSRVLFEWIKGGTRESPEEMAAIVLSIDR